MTLLMLEGFDTYGTTSTTFNNVNLPFALAPNWDTLSFTSPYNTQAAFFAGRSTGLSMEFLSDSANDSWVQRNFGSAHPTVILTCSMMPNTVTGSVNHAIFTLFDSAAVEMGRLYFSANNGQLIYRNGSGTTILTTTFSGGFLNLVWYTIELKVTAGTTTGSVQINANGSSVGSATSVNTVGAANTSGMQSLALGAKAVSANFNQHFLDHLIVMDSTGSAPLNDFIGEKRVYTLLPNGAGSHSDWTPIGAASHFAAVNEAGIDQDTTYVSSSTVGNTDSYTQTDLLSSSQAVYAVQVNGHIKNGEAAASRQCQLLVRSGGTDALVGSAVTLGSTYSTRLAAIVVQNPVSSSAWTNSDIASLEAGVRVTA